MSFDVAAEIEMACFQQLERFLRHIIALHVLLPDRHQCNRRILVTENML